MMVWRSSTQFQLNVIANVLQAVCGCLGTDTLHAHARFIALPHFSHRKWCHSLTMSCLQPTCPQMGFFFFSIAHLLLLIYLVSYSSLIFWPSRDPVFSALLPTHLQRCEGRFLRFSSEYSLPLCDLLFCFLFSLLFFIYPQPPSVWLDLHRNSHHASPHLKSPALRTCLWTATRL